MYIKGISGYLSKYEGTEVDAAVERTQSLDEELALKVDKTTEINGYPLSGDVNITAEDIGALSGTTRYGASLSWNEGILSLVDQVGYPLSSKYISASARWGEIFGDIADQTDLMEILNGKQATIDSSHKLSADLINDSDTMNKFATASQLSQISTNAGNISTIQGLIPVQATTSNQLADKAFVNSSISTNTANFIGTFSSVSELEAYSGTVTNNDYAFVINGVVTDNGDDWASFISLNAYDKTLLTNFDYAWVVNGSNFDLYRFDIVEQAWNLRVQNTTKASVTLNTAYNRYKATVSGSTVTWAYEYTLNNSSFTAAQWAAINSGITSGDVSLIATALQPNDNVSSLINDAGYISSASISTLTDVSLSNLSNGQFLKYNSTSSKWENYLLASTDITTALGYTPYDGATNSLGFLTAATLPVATISSLGIVQPDNDTVTISNGIISLQTEKRNFSQNGGTITNNIYYGATNKYLQMPSTLPLGTADSWEIQSRITPSSSDGAKATLFGYSGTSDCKTPAVFKDGSGWHLLVSTNGTSWNVTTSTVALTNGNTYDIKAGFTGTAYYFSYKLVTDSTWTTITTNSSTKCVCTVPMLIGNLGWNLSTYFSAGGIDLSVTQVVVNGSVYWRAISPLTPIATNTSVGTTKPDNSTIKIDYDGTLSIKALTNTMVTTALGYTPYDAANPSGYISAASISTLTDVSLSSLAGGQGLIYDATSGKWKNAAIQTSTAWGSITGTLADQTDLNTALSGKQATITGAATSVVSSDLTASRALISDSSGKIAVSSITSAKLGYLTDVTSNIQAQLNGKTTMNDVEAKGYITGISSNDVITALGYTPYSSSNPSGYISSASMSTLTDVSISSITGGQFLKYDSTSSKWKNYSLTSTDITDLLGYTPYNSSNPSGYISSAALSTLTDVSISSLLDGQHLVYDSASGKWKNQTSSATIAWGGITGTLADQTDLNTALNGKQATITGAATSVTSSDLTASRALVSDSSGKIAASSISSTKLSYLTDVTSNIQAQLNGKLSSASLVNLTDTNISSPTQGQNLVYDSTLGKWINASTSATVGWGGITGTLSDQTDLQNALNAIEGEIEHVGVYRGTFESEDSLPSSSSEYLPDESGSTTPLQNDYIKVNNTNEIEYYAWELPSGSEVPYFYTTQDEGYGYFSIYVKDGDNIVFADDSVPVLLTKDDMYYGVTDVTQEYSQYYTITRNSSLDETGKYYWTIEADDGEGGTITVYGYTTSEFGVVTSLTYTYEGETQDLFNGGSQMFGYITLSSEMLLYAGNGNSSYPNDSTENISSVGNTPYYFTYQGVWSTDGVSGWTKEYSLGTAITVDQTYGSTSTNAQSGVAVAEAIAGLTSSNITTALGYIPENQANKVTTISGASTDVQYPTAKFIYDNFNSYMPSSYISNVTLVGALDDTNGVLSGFSSSKYAKFTKDFPSTLSSQDWEFVIACKVTSLSPEYQQVMCSDDFGIGFAIKSDGTLAWYISGNGTSWNIAGGTASTLTVSANTQYYFKLGKSSGTTYLAVSTDKVNYTTYLSTNTSYTMHDTRFKFGISKTNVSPATYGIIDLRECYINVNGERWWSGTSMGTAPALDGFEEAANKVTSISGSSTDIQYPSAKCIYDTFGSYIFPSLTSNVTLVGSPTLNNGVLSGFSTSNYAKLSEDFPSTLSSQDWEFVIPYITTNLSATQQQVMCSDDYGIGFSIASDRKLVWYISGNGSSWDVANGVKSSSTVNANTQYYFKLGKSSGTTYLAVSTDRVNYTTYLSTNTSYTMHDTRFKFGISRSGGSPATYGTIDLRDAYINVNGERWWTGTTQEASPALSPYATKVWVEGKGYITQVDQTYSSSSTNAQSGIAVAQAISTKQNTIDSSNKLSADLVDDTSTTNKFATASQLSQIATNTGNISTINSLIPSEATSSNKLADKAFVNSSIGTNTANFIGTFETVTDLNSYSGTVTNNDYAFVVNSVVTDNGGDWSNTTALNAYDKTLLTNFDYAWVVNGSNFDLYRFDIVEQTWELRVSNTAKASVTLNTAYNRYKATVSGSTVTWAYEYTLNNSSFTASQWAAINSGITSSGVSLIGTALQPNDNISSLTNDSGYISSASISTLTDVTLSSVSNGQTLIYNSSSSKWVNGSAGATITFRDWS